MVVAEQGQRRKLAAILAADVAGYSRLMGLDEEYTVATLNARRAIFRTSIQEHNGRVVDTAGDSVLATFDSVVEAVRCASEIQAEIAECNVVVPKDQWMAFRIGINSGDVVEQGDGTIYGDAVNIAARLQALAEPGGIVVSEDAYRNVRNRVDLRFEDIGEQELKNIEGPVRAYRVVAGDQMSTEPDAARTSERSSSLDFSLPDKPSVAILPFKSLGSDPDQDYLADGIRLGIQATLVQLSGLFLVNVPAMNAYRERDVSATSVGADLSVRYVLEGAVQQAGKRIRATVQLTDVDAKQTVWAERYDRVVEDVFKLQDEITAEVISSLHIKLASSESDRVWVSKLSNPGAREFYYRGSSHLYEGNKADNAAARHMFEELYRVEPDSVQGPSMISLTHWLDAVFGWTDSSSLSIEQATEWAKKAIRYKDNNGLGYAVFGHLQLLDGKYDDAVSNCSKAVELRGSCPMAHGLMGLVFNFCGDSRSAVKSARQALHLSKVYPVWLVNILAAAYRDCGEMDLSVRAAKEAVRINPQENDARLILCSDYHFLAKHDQAGRVAEEIIARDPAFRLSTYAKNQPYKNTAVLDGLITVLRESGLPA